MRLYPQGDSDFANAVEREAPLAAWIASPQSERASRWKRIEDVVPQDWVDLIPVGELDVISSSRQCLKKEQVGQSSP